MARNSKSIEYLTEKELRERVRTSNTARQFGFVVQHAERGKVTMRMPVNARHKQVHGVVHGGVLAALADTAGGLATYMACPRRDARSHGGDEDKFPGGGGGWARHCGGRGCTVRAAHRRH